MNCCRVVFSVSGLIVHGYFKIGFAKGTLDLVGVCSCCLFFFISFDNLAHYLALGTGAVQREGASSKRVSRLQY